MVRRFLLICGWIAPSLFIGTVIFGGAIRPGYSHLSDTISELFSPGSPNKALLDPLHALYAILLALFGVGILLYVRAYEPARWMGIAGAGSYIAMGLISVTSATIFPQDAKGTPPTFAGEMHMLVHGLISVFGMLSMLLIGMWFARAKARAGFRTYSYITIGLAVLSAALFMETYQAGSRYLGLFERIAGLIGFQWTFVLAFQLLAFSPAAPRPHTLHAPRRR